MTTSNPLSLGTLLLGTLLALAGCSTAPPERDRSGPSLIDQAFEPAAQASAAAPPVPPEITSALLPPINLAEAGAGTAAEPRFDVTVNRANAEQFFMSLVEGTRYSVVVHPEVTGRISLDLRDVTIPEVMAVAEEVYGYETQRVGNHYRVLPAALRSRVFQVNYLDIRRTGSSQTRVSSGQVSELRGRGTAAMDDAGGDGRSGTLSGSRIDTTTESNFWQELYDSLLAIVGDAEGRSVVVSPQSGVVVVRAMPAELRAAEEFLRATQAVIQRQVVLEAKILEVELNEGFQSGINWAALGRSGSTQLLGGQVGGGTIFTEGTANTAGQSGVFDPENLGAVRDLVSNAFGGVFALSVQARDFTGFIELLETQGDVQVLSSPRVATVNNQKAVIKVGSDAFFVTDVETNTFLGTAVTASQSANVELTPFFSGVALDVVPQISEAGDIILHVHPTVSEVSEQIKNIGVATDTTLTVPLAVSTIRESDTVIRARSGQVVVIGGLMQNVVRDQSAGVPVLSRLPVVGGLFRHTRQVMRKSELVILLKATVVEDDWSPHLNATSGRMRGLRDAGGR